MTTLYLCEKPSQAKEVAEALGLSRKTDGAYVGDGYPECTSTYVDYLGKPKFK